MTDTNQASELYELCKKVYEKTGWCDTTDYVEERFVDGELVAIDVCKNVGYEDDDEVFGGVQRKHFPIYTSDYLLEKLSKRVDHLSLQQTNKLTIDSSDGEKGKWYAHYWLRSRRLQSYYCYPTLISSDTPLKALLKLTTALSEAGELK